MTFNQWQRELFALEQKLDEARSHTARTSNAVAEARRALERAEEAETKACTQESEVSVAHTRFIDQTMAALSDKLFTADILNAPEMTLTAQDGSVHRTAINDPWIDFTGRVYGGGKFSLVLDKTAAFVNYRLGEYNSPAEIEIVVDLLKAAIKRGETEFTFPTVEEVELIHRGTRINGEYVAVCYEGDDIGFVSSPKYNASFSWRPDGRKTYNIQLGGIKQHKRTEEEFFQIMAERGACTIDEPTTNTVE